MISAFLTRGYTWTVQGSSIHPMKPRHWTVTSLAVVVLLLAVSNWTRASHLWAIRDLLSELSDAAVPTTYLAGCATLWGGVWIIIAVGLWVRAAWARKLTLGAILLYQAHNWTTRWLFEISEYSRRGWPLDWMLSVLSVIMVWALLYYAENQTQFTNSR